MLTGMLSLTKYELETRANAQRDGRPAAHSLADDHYLTAMQ